MRSMDIVFLGDSLTEGRPGVSFFDILKDKLPDHNLINKGRGGDTVISLYRRIKRMNINGKIDIFFVWIGVNDILASISKRHTMIKLIFNQTWTKNIDDFREYYEKILNITTSAGEKTFTVSPALIGENINNKWNKKLGELCEVIDQVSSGFKNVEYIDLRREFFTVLSSKKTSDFIMNSITRDVIIAWLLNDQKRVDKKSKERNLFFTLDGVHLNSRGAELVADVFYGYIVKEVESKNIS